MINSQIFSFFLLASEKVTRGQEGDKVTRELETL